MLSENFESKELGIIGPNKCGHVKHLNRVIECTPGVFHCHTDGNHARAVIELMGLDVETSKPAPTLEACCATPRTSSMMRTEAHTAAQQAARLSITQWTVIELMGLDVETSKPAPTLEACCATPRTSSMMRTEAHTAAQQAARLSITQWTDPTSSFPRVVVCQGFRV